MVWLRKIGWLAVFACLVLAFGAEIWRGSQKTQRHEYKQPSVAKQQNINGGKSVAVAVDDKKQTKRQQEGNRYNVSITFGHLPDWFVALFSGLLVYVTYRLVNATGDLRDSTELNARVLLSSERAYMNFYTDKLVLDGAPPTLRCYVRNIGRTTGSIIEYRHELYFGALQAIPDTPHFTAKSKIRRVMVSADSGNQREFRRVQMERHLTQEEITEYRNGKKLFLLFGYFKYIDRFRTLHTHGLGILFRHDDENDHELLNNDAYNYERSDPLPDEAA